MTKESNLILIVDDVEENHGVIGNILFSKGIDVMFAKSGKEALKRISSYKPDLILLDIMMPEMSGFEVCKILKSKEETADIPIIFLTAMEQTENIVEGFRLGAVDYILKPFKKEELIQRVDNQLRIKNLLDAYKHQNEDLIATNATKDKLFSIIAHDLRNPFNIIMGYSKMLVDNFQAINDEKKIEFIKRLHEVTKQTSRLLENLLQWSQLRTGSNKFTPIETNLQLLIEDAVNVISEFAQQKQIKVINKVNTQTHVWADQNMVATVLRNLLSNAVKFTKKGDSITIQTEENDDYIKVCVIDTGVGIKEENLSKLFKIDTTFTTKGTERESGTGIGLVLCKEFVEKNGGEIQVESEEGKGSRFYFTIPVKK